MNERKLSSVLYVDDEPDIREIVEMSLSLAEGLRVHSCESGQRALEILPALMPDLVLLDVMMPGMDGPATLTQMREHINMRALPVVFITAKVLPREIDRLKNLGAAGVISKPFDPMKLVQQVQDIWRTVSRHD